MSTARQLRYSNDDCLRALEASPFKLEYSAGVIYAVAGGTQAHGELTIVLRDGEAWKTTELGAGERCALPSPRVTLEVDRIYSGIPLDPS